MHDVAASLPEQAREMVLAGLGRALIVAERLPNGAALVHEAKTSFIGGMQVALWVAAGLLIIGAVAVNRTFPAVDDDVADGTPMH